MGRSAPAGLTNRERAELQKQGILDDWAAGATIAEISRSRQITRPVVSETLEEAGVRSDRPDPRSRARERKREEVLRWIRSRPGSSVDDVVAATGVTHRTLVGYIAGTPERQLVVERRKKVRDYTDEEMEAHVRAVWDSLPPDQRSGGLSKKRFAALASEGAPSPALYDRRYKSWVAACEAAGVPPGRTYRSSYTKEYPDEAILDSIAEYITETSRTSFHGYSDWASVQPPGKHASGALVVLRFGTWSAARKKLLHRGSAA